MVEMTKGLIAAWGIFLLLGGCADNSPIVGPYPKSGKASWYSAKRTYAGAKFDSGDLTCAMRKTDFGKYYKVCNTANDRCVVVRHNDFGPAKHMYVRGRIIDLSKAAFSQISDLKEGIIDVTIEEME